MSYTVPPELTPHHCGRCGMWHQGSICWDTDPQPTTVVNVVQQPSDDKPPLYIEVTDDMVDRGAIVLAGPAPCWCPDDWRADTPAARKGCPQHGNAAWPEERHRVRARRTLEAALHGE
jgi:hypothetical protein